MMNPETFAVCSLVQEVTAIPEELLLIPPQGKVPAHTLYWQLIDYSLLLWVKKILFIGGCTGQTMGHQPR